MMERRVSEDVPQRAKAISEGFKPRFYPNLLEEDARFRAIAEKHKVAPLAPQPNTDLYHCNEGYGLTKYRTDKFGFRNKNDSWIKSVDVVLIGDSFTHGACVAHDQTIAGNLEVSLNVLNLGTDANTPIHYAALAKVFLPKINPKYAALVFYANDNEAGSQESYFYKSYFVENRSYFKEEGEVLLSPNLEAFYKEATSLMQEIIDSKISQQIIVERTPLLQRAAKYLSIPGIRGMIGAHIPLLNELDFGSRLAIDSLVSACRRSDCKPMVVYISNSDFWVPDLRARGYEKSLAEYASRLNIPFWSSRSEFLKTHNNEAYAIKGPHLSPLGYSIVAKGIRDLVKSD